MGFDDAVLSALAAKARLEDKLLIFEDDNGDGRMDPLQSVRGLGFAPAHRV
ncbi:MAG: hypothetical protein R3C20_17840 [Planctomycetaceae bacterium]